MSIASPLVQPSPNGRRVGIRIVTFEACSGFTRVTARRIAQPPKATFVARLRPSQLPGRAARQLPDLSTIIRVRSSLTDGSRLRGALPTAELMHRSKQHHYSITSSAWASSVGGTVRPSVLAVLRLTMKSNLVGCSTGKSAGLAPLRILVHKGGRSPQVIGNVRAVGHQASVIWKLAKAIDGREAAAGSQGQARTGAGTLG